MENKQIVISKNLHRHLKSYCAQNDEKIKEYTEAALEFAINNKLTVEELKEKQYRDSLASTDMGGPMVRYGQKNISDNIDAKDEKDEDDIPDIRKQLQKLNENDEELDDELW